MGVPKGITQEQRYFLCLKKQESPSMKQSELAAWFEARYLFPISQPCISNSLKKSAEILARGPCPVGLDSTRVRSRPVRHPELELVIYEWVQARQLEQQQRWQQQQQQRQQIRQKRKRRSSHDRDRQHAQNQEDEEDGDHSAMPAFEPLTGSTLIRQAKKMAQEMHIEDTVFCPGWLTRFKSRYNITFVNLDEIPPQSRGAITIASNNDNENENDNEIEDEDENESGNENDQDDYDNNSSSDPSDHSDNNDNNDNDIIPASATASGLSTPVSGPSWNSFIGMTLTSLGIHPSLTIPSSSHGAYSLLPDAVKTINLANIHLEQNDFSDAGLLEDLVSMESLPNNDRYPYQQQQQHQPQQSNVQDYTPNSISPDQQQHSLLQQQHQQTSRHFNIPHSTAEPNEDHSNQAHSGNHFRASPSLSEQRQQQQQQQHNPGSNLLQANAFLPSSLQGHQDVQRALGLLRQYASSHLPDSSRALSSLDDLELELVTRPSMSWQT